MTKIIEKTMEHAAVYLESFGFSKEQVAPLLVQAKNDLTKELEKAEMILNTAPIDHEAVNNVLHALKGLLYSLGNEEMAKKIEALREEDDTSRDVEEIKALLFGFK